MTQELPIEPFSAYALDNIEAIVNATSVYRPGGLTQEDHEQVAEALEMIDEHSVEWIHRLVLELKMVRSWLPTVQRYMPALGTKSGKPSTTEQIDNYLQAIEDQRLQIERAESASSEKE